MVATLPENILTEILRNVKCSSLTKYTVYITFSAVCRAWRFAAISSPLLWGDICLDITLSYPPPSLIRLWLERSVDIDVDIIILDVDGIMSMMSELDPWAALSPAFQTRSRKDRREYIPEALHVLGGHIHQWIRLKILSVLGSRVTGQGNRNRLSIALPLMELPFIRAERLESLQLSISDVTPRDEEKLLTSALSQIPNLREFHWSIARQRETGTGLTNFPWNRLKHIDISGYLPQFLVILPQFSSAVTLDLATDQCRFPYDHSIPSMTFNSLKGLTICFHDDVLEMIQGLAFPNLEILHVKPGGDVDSREAEELIWDNLSAFLQSTHHSLKVLYLENPDCLERIRNELLRALFIENPRLHELIALKVELERTDDLMETIAGVRARLEETRHPVAGRLRVREPQSRRSLNSYISIGWVLKDEASHFLSECQYGKKMPKAMDFENFPGGL